MEVFGNDFPLDQDSVNGQDPFNLSVIEAIATCIIKECRESALGTCLLFELERFVDSLTMNPLIADFPMRDIFRFVRFEDGLPKSAILQREKLE